MTDNDERKGPKYESPTVIPLGELARGSGQCTAGSGVLSDGCATGDAPGLIFVCTAGGMPSSPSCAPGSGGLE